MKMEKCKYCDCYLNHEGNLNEHIGFCSKGCSQKYNEKSNFRFFLYILISGICIFESLLYLAKIYLWLVESFSLKDEAIFVPHLISSYCLLFFIVMGSIVKENFKLKKSFRFAYLIYIVYNLYSWSYYFKYVSYSSFDDSFQIIKIFGFQFYPFIANVLLLFSLVQLLNKIKE